jgi:UDP-N-acetyl-D-galactosamine dehydrogenase
MGATFKEDVSDIRNSKVADIVKELKSFGVKVEIVDPHADSNELKHEYGFGLNKLAKGYDGVIVAVNHQEYKTLDEKYFKTILAPKGVIVDIKGMYKNKIKGLTYWSL